MKSKPLIRSPLAQLCLALSASVTLMLGACASLPSSGDSEPEPATGFVYSANESEDSISRIDLATGRITTLPLPVTPHNVQISRDGRWLFAVGSMSGQRKMATPAVTPAATPGGHAHAAAKEPGGLLIFDATTANAASATLVAVGRAPAHVIVDARGERAFVTPDGNFMYAADQGTEQEPDNTVSVIETRRSVVVKTLTTDRGAHGVVVSDDGSRVFIANTFAGTVSTIDAATQRVMGSVRVGSGPGGFTYRPGSR